LELDLVTTALERQLAAEGSRSTSADDSYDTNCEKQGDSTEDNIKVVLPAINT
jgi:hypothetical protein